MSKDTRSTMEEAMRAHFVDEARGAYMTDYHLVIAGVSVEHEEPTHGYLYEDGSSPFHVSYGLAQMGVDYLMRTDDVGEDE